MRPLLDIGLVHNVILNIYDCSTDVPKFVDSGSNVTVVVGRDTTLTCKVENLNDYKVGTVALKFVGTKLCSGSKFCMDGKKYSR